MDSSESVNVDPLTRTNELHVAAARGDLESIRQLVTGSNIEINGRNLNSEGIEHSAPLHFAATYGQLEAVKLLLELGADINATDRSGMTPMYRAIQNKRRDTVAFLIESGADVRKKDSNLLDACFWAAKTGDIEIFKVIWNCTSWGVNDTEKNGMTIFHYAAKNSNWEIVQFLLQFNPDPNYQDLQGMTPLKRVAKAGKWDIVSLLLKNNGDLEALTQKQQEAYKKIQDKKAKKNLQAS